MKTSDLDSLVYPVKSLGNKIMDSFSKKNGVFPAMVKENQIPWAELESRFGQSVCLAIHQYMGRRKQGRYGPTIQEIEEFFGERHGFGPGA